MSGMVDRFLFLIHQCYTKTTKSLSSIQIVLIQQIGFFSFFTVVSSVYQINLDLDAFANVVTITKALKITDYKIIVELLENEVKPPQVFTFGSILIFLAVLYTISSVNNTGKSDKNATTKSSWIIFSVIIWVLCCFHIFIPLRFSFSSRIHNSVLSFLQNPLSSLVVVLMMACSVPFSLVYEPPLVFRPGDHYIINRKLSEALGKHIEIPATVDLADFYTISYNWSILLPLVMFILSCVTFMLYSSGEKAQRDHEEDSEVVIKRGSVKKLSLNFEDKRIPPQIREKPKIPRKPIIMEDAVKPVIISPLTQSQPKVPVTLAKVRPVNVTKPLNMKSVQDQQNPPLLPGSPLGNRNIDDMQNENGNTGHTKDLKKLDTSANADNSGKRCEASVQFSTCCEDSSTQTFKTIRDHSSQTATICNKDSSSQTLIRNTEEVQVQYEALETKSTGEQTESVKTCEKGVFCEILSQERYVKLQQSALALYKKTVEHRDYTYMSPPKKVQVSANVTKFNKSVQTNCQTYKERDDPIKSVNDKLKEVELRENQMNKEIQTDLFGYVLDKMIQERESCNRFSKIDVERAVHSVLTLSEKIKQHTETIKFKAMKSQHGVWYVSLRGDIFLTISQDILKNIKLNVERKIETEVSSDILRAMKLFVDNYNKLSDCFDDDIESDDESFINGFRL